MRSLSRDGDPMSTPNKDDTDTATDTEDNEVDDDESVTTKWHIDIEDSVDSQGKLTNTVLKYQQVLNT